jgi:hypothetical protein
MRRIYDAPPFSIRLAWHDTSWNGHTCHDPRINTYYADQHSLNDTACLMEEIDQDIESHGGWPIE